MRMRTRLCSLRLMCAVGLMLCAAPLATVSAETVQRTVRGTVIATNTAVDPHTIVVKVILPNRDEMIVGTRVPADTRIRRGSRTIQLAGLKAGETASLTYLKSPDGLIARSIHVR